jgi:hypothetical protein
VGNSSSTIQETQWVPVDFEQVELRPGDGAGYRILEVTGSAPSFSPRGCRVRLEPVSHGSQPEYWQIHVLWDSSHTIVESLCPFKASLTLDGIPGSKGIEVVGKTRSKKIPYNN